MSAMPDHRRPRPVESVRRNGYTMQESAVHGDLCYWGDRYTRILLSTGFSSFSPFAGLFEGRADTFCSKVLIPDMTARAWEINMRLWSIKPVEYVWAIVARYALPMRADDGHPFEPEEIAAALGCTRELYRQRLTRGRKAYQRKLFEGVTE